MKKYEVMHEVTLSWRVGEVEAENLGDAQTKADALFEKECPMNREEYQENSELIVDEV